VKDSAAAAKLLVTLGDVPEVDAATAAAARGARVGSFTRTAALWLRQTLHHVGTEARMELL
jgi:hypothetical protein